MAENRVYWARLRALPKYSFFIEASGGVSRAEDSTGNWMDRHLVQSIVDDAEVALSAAHQEIESLRARLDEVHSWIVCAPIASAQDMLQNAEHIAAITAPQETNHG